MKKIIIITIVVFMVLGVNSVFSEGQKEKTEGGMEKEQLRWHQWTWQEPPFAPLWEELVGAYVEEHPNVEFIKDNTPYSQFWEKMYTEISAGNPSDFYMTSLPHPIQLMEMGVLEPLDKWISPELREAFSPVINGSACSKDGKTYGLPLATVGGCSLFYNQDMYNAAGIENTPTNPAEYLSLGDKMTNAPAQYGAGLSSSGKNLLYQDIHLVIIGFGSDIAQNGKFTINAPKTIEAVKWYKSLFDQGVAPKGVDSLKLRELFWEGKLGMTLQGPWAIGQVKAQNPEFEMMTATLPWENGSSWILVMPFVIPKDAKNKEGAWEFLEFYAQREWQARYIEMTGIPTGRTDLMDSDVVKKEPLMKPFLTLLENPKNELRTVKGFETDAVQIYSMLEDTMTEILIGKVSVEDGLNTLQKQLEKKFY